MKEGKMTNAEKKRLLLELCPRIPYGVKIDRIWTAPMTGSPEHCVDEVGTFDIDYLQWGFVDCEGKLKQLHSYSAKPLLRPMDSITDREIADFNKRFEFVMINRCGINNCV